MEKTIYDLKLHETTYFEGWEITRVASGWIYGGFGGKIFIPFDNSFENK